MDESPEQERPRQSPKVIYSGPHATPAFPARPQATGTGVFNPPIARADSWSCLNSSNHRGSSGDGGRRGTIHEDGAADVHTPLGQRLNSASSSGARRHQHAPDGRPMRRTGSSSALSSTSRDGTRDAYFGHGDRSGGGVTSPLKARPGGPPPTGPSTGRRDSRSGGRRSGLLTSPSLPAMPVLPGSPTLPLPISGDLYGDHHPQGAAATDSPGVATPERPGPAPAAVSTAGLRPQFRSHGHGKDSPSAVADGISTGQDPRERGDMANGNASASTGTAHAVPATRQPPDVVSPYMQMVLHAGGNALTLVLAALVWFSWRVLADFRDAMLMALLCSVALRDVRDTLVASWRDWLSADRTLVTSLLLLMRLPFSWLIATARDLRQGYEAWRTSARSYMRAHSKQQVAVQQHQQQRQQQQQHGAEMPQPAGLEAEQRQSKSKRQQHSGKAHNPQGLGGLADWIAVVAALGVRALRSASFRRSRRSAATVSGGGSGGGGAPSAALFRWLFCACLAYQACAWLKGTWAAALQTALLMGTALATLGALPLLFLTASWYLSMAAPTESPSSLETAWRKPESEARGDGRPPVMTLSQRLLPGTVQRAWASAFRGAYTADAHLREALSSNMDALVAVGLIVGTLLGATLLSVFFAVQIGQESRAAVSSIHEALPSNWTAVGNQSAAVGPLPATARAWLGDYEQPVLRVVQRAGPAVSTWLEARLESFAEANNLTEVADDMRTLYTSLRPPVPCSRAERRHSLVDLARGEIDAQALVERRVASAAKVAELDARLSSALAAWQDSADDVQPPVSAADGTASEGRARQAAVVAADTALTEQQRLLEIVDRAAGAALERVKRARDRVARCQAAEKQSSVAAQPQVAGMPAAVVAGRLAGAYRKLAQLRVREGLLELKAVCTDAVYAAQEAQRAPDGGAGGEPPARRELRSLQRVAAAAADPMVRLGRSAAGVAARRLGSTSALALTGGVGVLRISVGLFKLGIQFTLFAVLLYYLLAAPTDPLEVAVRVLPLSTAARERTIAAFSGALRAVFLSSIKLAMFHAVFTWLTFRMFGVLLVYVSTLASAVGAVMPLVPVWLIAVPAAAQLALQGRAAAGLVLLALHLGAWELADSIIMAEIPGTHAYVAALSVLGGIATFNNPLQGALLGPMIVAALVVTFNLHVNFIGAELPHTTQAQPSLSRATSVASVECRLQSGQP